MGPAPSSFMTVLKAPPAGVPHWGQLMELPVFFLALFGILSSLHLIYARGLIAYYTNA
jgi:hypothetical protein